MSLSEKKKKKKKIKQPLMATPTGSIFFMDAAVSEISEGKISKKKSFN